MKPIMNMGSKFPESRVPHRNKLVGVCVNACACARAHVRVCMSGMSHCLLLLSTGEARGKRSTAQQPSCLFMKNHKTNSRQGTRLNELLTRSFWGHLGLAGGVGGRREGEGGAPEPAEGAVECSGVEGIVAGPACAAGGCEGLSVGSLRQ